MAWGISPNLSPCRQFSPRQERSLPYVFSQVASLHASPPFPQRQASYSWPRKVGRRGGQGTGWSLLWRLLVDCPVSWPHAGKKRRKQSGPSEWPVPSRVWGPTAPSSLLHKQSKLQWIWKSLYFRASTPQPHQPIPGELILRPA